MSLLHYSEPYRFLLTPEARDLYTPLTMDQGWNLLEPRNEDEGSASSVGQDGVLSESQLFLPGSGLAKILYSQWSVLTVCFSCVTVAYFQLKITLVQKGSPTSPKLCFVHIQLSSSP